jgi:hypothetical protein
MSDYQNEQRHALTQIKNHLKQMAPDELDKLHGFIATYIDFRREVDRFLDLHFAVHCTQSCYQSRISACCSKDGIITFWADLVINACRSTPAQVDRLLQTIDSPYQPHKCIYLGPSGCCWELRPLVCAMFLCDAVQEKVFAANPTAKKQWCRLKARAKGFRWPDRPVLFDHLEHLFMAAGCRSTLMLLNTSPGLLRIKRQAGLTVPNIGD